VSDEGDVADLSSRAHADGQTAVVTEPALRPQRPTGKRARLRADTDPDVDDVGVAPQDEVEVTEGSKKDKAAAKKAGKAKKPAKAGDGSANPFVFVYNYLRQVVAELRKVIWPNRKQMLSYTGVVLVFLAFMVALVGLADLGLAKLVMLMFG